MENKNNMKKFVEEVAEILEGYIYENSNSTGMNGENVIIVAPFAEINDKLREVVRKYAGEVQGL